MGPCLRRDFTLPETISRDFALDPESSRTIDSQLFLSLRFILSLRCILLLIFVPILARRNERVLPWRLPSWEVGGELVQTAELFNALIHELGSI